MEHEPATIERLDRALLLARRAVTLPELSSLPLPELDRTLDPAKALACMAVADLTKAHPGRTVTVKDVAAALALEHSTASRLLSDTEALGLMARDSDPQDRRRTSVTLTPTGQHVVRQIAEIRNWALGELLAQWPKQDVVKFAELIEGFTDALNRELQPLILRAAEQFRVGAPD